MANPTHKQLVALLKKLRKSDDQIMELFHPSPVEFRQYPNIRVTFSGFEDWLDEYPFEVDVQAQLGTLVRSYEKSRDHYLKSVLRELATIKGFTSGTALLNEIKRGSPRKVTIRPWQKTEQNAEERPLNQKRATRQNFCVRDTDGDPVGGECILDRHLNNIGDADVGTGEGSYAEVNISPDMYLPIASDVKGPASRPDEVLFHELVHASRDVNGVSYLAKMNRGYDNQEEFYAVVLTNIYVSEKTKDIYNLRESHTGHTVLQDPEHFLDNVQKLSTSPRVLMDQMQIYQFNFYVVLSNIPASIAPFNPVRQYEEDKWQKTLERLQNEPMPASSGGSSPARRSNKGNKQLIDL